MAPDTPVRNTPLSSAQDDPLEALELGTSSFLLPNRAQRRHRHTPARTATLSPSHARRRKVRRAISNRSRARNRRAK